MVLRVQVRVKTWSKGCDRVAFDDVVACPSTNGNGFALLNNVIGNMRGRGALVKSSNGVIANNVFFNLMFWALELAPEWGWKESDFVHNILIANNSINSNGTGIWLGLTPTIGACRRPSRSEHLTLNSLSVHKLQMPSGAFPNAVCWWYVALHTTCML